MFPFFSICRNNFFIGCIIDKILNVRDIAIFAILGAPIPFSVGLRFGVLFIILRLGGVYCYIFTAYNIHVLWDTMS